MRRSIAVFATVALAAMACGGSVENETESTSETTTIAAPETTLKTTIPVPTTSVQPVSTTTTAAGPVELTSGSFKIPFSTEVPTGFRFTKEAKPDTVYFQIAPNDNAFLIVTTRGPETTADWAAAVQGQPITTSNEPTDAVVGGIAGSYIEFAAEDSTPAPGEIAFTFEPGDMGRVYVVQVGGEPVTLLAVAGADLWPSFQDVVDALISGFVWK